MIHLTDGSKTKMGQEKHYQKPGDRVNNDDDHECTAPFCLLRLEVIDFLASFRADLFFRILDHLSAN